MLEQNKSLPVAPVEKSGATDALYQQAQGTKYLWKWKSVDPESVRTIAYKHNISIPIAHVLAARGFVQEEQVRSFLFSSYDQDVPHSRLLKGMDIAVKRIIKAIQAKEKILV